MYKQIFVLCCFLLIVFGGWISRDPIIGGDWPYKWPDTLVQESHIPTAWGSTQGGGLGGMYPSYFLVPYGFLSSLISQVFQIPWILFYKIVWFFGPILWTIVGGYYLAKRYDTNSSSWGALCSGCLLVGNTYALMIIGGGQMGVFIAYSFVPWVLWAMRTFIDSTNRSNALKLGLLFGVQISLDPRIAYISAIALFLILAFERLSVFRLKQIVGYGLLASLVIVGINAYWILPVAVLGNNPLETLGTAYTSVSALRFFSFADFSHTLSLLHPNWPDNIFGKISFLKPEFLIFPILAFSSLIFAKRTYIVFALIGLVGVFFSKGANPPFGELYVWFFEHIPGFVMFRDPSKFYVLIAISYAVLIPYVVQRITRLVKIMPFIFILFWGFTLIPVISGSLGGTFATRFVPKEYKELTTWLSQETGYFRTLWVPRQSRFAYSSEVQTPVEADPLLHATDSASILTVFNDGDTKDRLSRLGFRYVIIPHDPYGEIFHDDYQYSEHKRQVVENALDTIDWLTKVQDGALVVYKTPFAHDLFWFSDKSHVKWKKISDDEYQIDVDMQTPKQLEMSITHHRGWQLMVHGMIIKPQKTDDNTMSFLMPSGTYVATIKFAPRYFFYIGRIISLITIMLLFFLKGKKI